MKFYKIYDDGDNKFLIPLSDWDTVMNLAELDDKETLSDLLDWYDRLEGQAIVVMLESEVEV